MPRTSFGVALLALSFVSSCMGHARVTTPTPRAIGAANLAACGAAVNKVLKSDLAGPIENSVAKIDSSYNAQKCHLYFCKGYQYEDNVSNTRVYPAGTVVDFHVDIVAHHTGHANVSIVDLATQTTIGKPVFLWPVYADTSIPWDQKPKNETDFQVVVPDMKGKCTKGGACAIQWWWYADSNRQTYESCIDFTQ